MIIVFVPRIKNRGLDVLFRLGYKQIYDPVAVQKLTHCIGNAIDA